LIYTGPAGLEAARWPPRPSSSSSAAASSPLSQSPSSRAIAAMARRRRRETIGPSPSPPAPLSLGPSGEERVEQLVAGEKRGGEGLPYPLSRPGHRVRPVRGRRRECRECACALILSFQPSPSPCERRPSLQGKAPRAGERCGRSQREGEGHRRMRARIEARFNTQR